MSMCGDERESTMSLVTCVCASASNAHNQFLLPQKHSISNANTRGNKMGGVVGVGQQSIICRKTPVLHSRHTHTTSFPNNMTYFIQFRVLNRQRCQDDESAEYNDTWTLLDENKIPLYPCKKFVTNKWDILVSGSSSQSDYASNDNPSPHRITCTLNINVIGTSDLEVDSYARGPQFRFHLYIFLNILPNTNEKT